MERSVLTGLAGFRWAAWAWMATVLALARGRLDAPTLAAALVLAALAFTVVATLALRARPEALLRPPLVATEVAVGVALVAADGVVYPRGHAFSPEPSLGVGWPLAGVLAAGVAGGPWAGLVAGVAMGLARTAAALANAAPPTTPARTISLVSTTVMYALAGTVAGAVVRLLRRAEREISAARAREEVARTLHDGVLQTLAVVERRADDPSLARLAREQELELRRYLFGDTAPGRRDRPALAPALRELAARHEDAFGGRVDVLVPDDLPELAAATTDALVGAVREALTNAGKHGGATRVTVYLEPHDDGVFCAVKDDGAGFDPASVREGVGLSRSIRGRLAEVGGTVEVASRPGRGTEVRMWAR